MATSAAFRVASEAYALTPGAKLGSMTFSVTVLVAPTTAVEKRDQPLESAPNGSLCKSDSDGAAAEESPNEGCEEGGGGAGVLPKPAYRPPWFGGR